MSDLFPTRGYHALPSNISPKRLAARTKKSVANIREKTEQLAAPWADVDNSVEGALCQLMIAFDEFENRIDQSVKFLLETAP